MLLVRVKYFIILIYFSDAFKFHKINKNTALRTTITTVGFVLQISQPRYSESALPQRRNDEPMYIKQLVSKNKQNTFMF